GISKDGVYTLGRTTADRILLMCVPSVASQVTNKAVQCADPMKKDQFLEIDYLHFHQPSTAAGGPIDLIVQMLANSPVQNPDGSTGIRLHVEVDEEVTFLGQNHYNNLAFAGCTGPATATDPADFDLIKGQFFGTAAQRPLDPLLKAAILNAKALVFRYGFMAHNLLGLGSTSGCGEIGGNDFVVAMGSWGSI